MARKHRKFLLGLATESAPLYGKDPTTSEQVAMRALTFQEIQRFKKENPLSSLEAFEVRRAEFEDGKTKRRPKVFGKKY